MPCLLAHENYTVENTDQHQPRVRLHDLRNSSAIKASVYLATFQEDSSLVAFSTVQ